MKHAVTVITVFFILFLSSGCVTDHKGNGQAVQQSDASIELPTATFGRTEPPYASPLPEQHQPASTPPGRSQPSADLHHLDSWLGDYTYSEIVPPDINMFYSISVSETTDGYNASIKIDGFQTMNRLQAQVTGDDKAIEFTLEGYMPGNVLEPYQRGERLLRLEKGPSGILTYWGAVAPIDQKHRSGLALFEKNTSESKREMPVLTAGQAAEAYQAILANQTAFISTDEKQKKVTLNEFLTNQQVYETEFIVNGFTVLDLDADQIPEVVLELKRPQREYADFYEVLSWKNGEVYGYIQVLRGFNDLKTDGTFRFSSGASHNGIGRLVLRKDSCEIDVRGYYDETEGVTTILLGNEPATEEAYNTFNKLQKEKADVTWHPFSIQNLEKALAAILG